MDKMLHGCFIADEWIHVVYSIFTTRGPINQVLSENTPSRPRQLVRGHLADSG